MKARICLALLFVLVLSGLAFGKKPGGKGGSGSNAKQASFEIFTPSGSGLTSDGGGIYEQSEDEPGVAAYFNGAQNAVFDLDDRLSSRYLEFSFATGDSACFLQGTTLTARGSNVRFSGLQVGDTVGDGTGIDVLDRFFGLQEGETGTTRMAIAFPDPEGGNYNYQVMFGESLHGNSVDGERVLVQRSPQDTWTLSGLDAAGVSKAYVLKSTSKGKAQVVAHGPCLLEVHMQIVCVNDDCPVLP